MRLIDVDALGIGKCNPDVFNDKTYANGWNSAIEILQNAPTVDDVAEVRHGHWRKTWNVETGAYDAICSNCDRFIIPADVPIFSYCPLCGARMDESEFAKDTNVPVTNADEAEEDAE